MPHLSAPLCCQRGLAVFDSSANCCTRRERDMWCRIERLLRCPGKDTTIGALDEFL